MLEENEREGNERGGNEGGEGARGRVRESDEAVDKYRCSLSMV
jgi:hypothetical protein